MLGRELSDWACYQDSGALIIVSFPCCIERINYPKLLDFFKLGLFSC